MSSKTLNLRQSPYYQRNTATAFSKVLFKPGFALQSSELIEIQDILQNQIKELSDHIFHDGSIVQGSGLNEPPGPVGENFNCFLYQVELENDFAIPKYRDGKRTKLSFENLNTTVPDLTFITFKKKFNDTINLDENGLATSYKNDFIVIKADGKDSKPVSVSDSFYLQREGEPGFDKVATIVDAKVYKGRYVTTGGEDTQESSVFYVNNHFIPLPADDYVFAVDYVNGFDLQVGIEVAEKIITVDDDTFGTGLLDPAQNSFNANTPGADRLQLLLQLTHHSGDYSQSTTDWKFYPLIKYENGSISYRVLHPFYNELGDTLADRTFEINGNFVVNGMNTFDLSFSQSDPIAGSHTINSINGNEITIQGINTSYDELKEGSYLMFGDKIDYNRLLRVETVVNNNEIKVSKIHFDEFIDEQTFGEGNVYSFVEKENIILRDERYLNFDFDKGTAYIKGYRFETTTKRKFENLKSRTVVIPENSAKPTQNKEFLQVNTDDLKYLNSGLDFYKLNMVDMHVTDTANIHFANVVSSSETTIEVTGNPNTSITTVGSKLPIAPTSNNYEFTTNGFVNGDYVQILDEDGKFLENSIIRDINSVGTEAKIEVITTDGTQTGSAKYLSTDHLKKFKLKKLSSRDSELILYNSTRFGNLRLHTSKISSDETELHFSHWKDGETKRFIAANVTSNSISNIITIDVRTPVLSEKNGVYENLVLKVQDEDRSWNIESYKVANKLKTFEIKVPNSYFSNMIGIGANLEVQQVSTKSIKALANTTAGAAGTEKINFQTELRLKSDGELDIETSGRGRRRFSYIYPDFPEREIKSADVTDIHRFYQNLSDSSGKEVRIKTPGNQISFDISDASFSGGVDNKDIAVYAKAEIKDATNTTTLLEAGERVDVESVVINEASTPIKLEIEIAKVSGQDYPVGATFILYGILPEHSKVREKTKTFFRDVFPIKYIDNKFDVSDANTSIRVLDGETLYLKHADIYRIRKIWIGVNKNVTSVTDAQLESQYNDVTYHFIHNNGQKDAYYDLGNIRQKSHFSHPAPTNGTGTNTFVVDYDYFEPTDGSFFTVDSYTDIHYRQIPVYENEDGKHPLRNVVDYRPVRNPLGSELEFENEFALYGQITCNTRYYDAQTKVAYVQKNEDKIDNQFERISLQVKDKNDYLSNDNQMKLYDVTIPSYTFNIFDVQSTMIDQNGYKMKDIAKLQKRIENVEDIVKMNSLELQVLNSNFYSNTGDPTFANGLLVDMFAGFQIPPFFQDKFNASIDLEKMELHPAFRSYAERIDFVSTMNIEKKNNILMLPTTTTVPLVDTITTKTAKAQTKIGEKVDAIPKLSLHPFSNFWYDQQGKIKINRNDDAQFKNWSDQTVKSGHGTQWADWEQFWSGVEADETESSLSANLLSHKANQLRNNKNNIAREADGKRVNKVLSYPNAETRVGFLGEMLEKDKEFEIAGYTFASGNRITVTYAGQNLESLERNFLYRKIREANNPTVTAVVQKILPAQTANQYYFYLSNVESTHFTNGSTIAEFTGSVDDAKIMDKIDEHGIACGDITLKDYANPVSIDLKYKTGTTVQDTVIASADFYSAGLLPTKEGYSESIRPVHRKIYKQQKERSYIEDQTNIIHAGTNIPIPAHQAFVLKESCMISKITLVTTNSSGEFMTTIQPYVNGNISPSIVLPFSEKIVRFSSSGNVSIVYDVPIYIPADRVYALTLSSIDEIQFSYFEDSSTDILPYSFEQEKTSFNVSSVIQNAKLMMKIEKAQFPISEKQFSMSLANTNFKQEIDQVRLNLNAQIADQVKVEFYSNLWSLNSSDPNIKFPVNETKALSQRKIIDSNTFELTGKLSTQSANFTPMIDLERFYMTMIHHRVENGEMTKDDVILKTPSVDTANTFSIVLTEYDKNNASTGRKLSVNLKNDVIDANTFSCDENFLLENETFKTELKVEDSNGVFQSTGSTYLGQSTAYLNNLGQTSKLSDANSFPKVGSTTLIDKIFTEYNNKDETLTADEYNEYRYYSPSVELKENFEAMQIQLQTDAILQSDAEKMYVYYKVMKKGDQDWDDVKEWKLMESITQDKDKYTSDISKSKLIEFKTRRPDASGRFTKFQVKIRFISSNYVKAPILKNIRIIALDS